MIRGDTQGSTEFKTTYINIITNNNVYGIAVQHGTTELMRDYS